MNRRKPLSSIYLTISPISSMWAASITFDLLPCLTAIRFPMGSSVISSTYPLSSFFIRANTLPSLPDTPWVLDNFRKSSLTMLISCSCFDPIKGPHEVFPRGGITEPGIVRCICTKSRTRGQNNATVNNLLYERRFHRHKRIKRPFRYREGETDIGKAFAKQIASCTVLIPHLADWCLVSGIGCESRILGDRSRTCLAVLVHLEALADNSRRGSKVPEPPAGHRVRLAYRVYRDHVVAKPGSTHMLFPVDEMFVDLITDNSDPCIASVFNERLDRILALYRASRVCRGVEDKESGAVHERLSLFEIDMECFIQRDANWPAAGNHRERRIGNKTRVGAEYHVPVAHERLHNNMERLACTCGNQDLVGAILQFVLFFEFGADRIPELGNPRVYCVPGLSCLNRSDGRILDVLWRIKIRLAEPEVYRVRACRFKDPSYPGNFNAPHPGRKLFFHPFSP